MPRALKAVVAVFALAYGHASAQTIILLQSIPITFTCLAQVPESAAEFWNSVPPPVPDSGFVPPQDERQRLKPILVDSAWAACTRRKQWVSKEFCRDLLEANKVGRRETASAMVKYQAEREGMRVMYEYFEAAFPRGGEVRPDAPACPE